METIFKNNNKTFKFDYSFYFEQDTPIELGGANRVFKAKTFASLHWDNSIKKYKLFVGGIPMKFSVSKEDFPDVLAKFPEYDC